MYLTNMTDSVVENYGDQGVEDVRQFKNELKQIIADLDHVFAINMNRIEVSQLLEKSLMALRFMYNAVKDYEIEEDKKLKKLEGLPDEKS